jgi:hypothetical protein
MHKSNGQKNYWFKAAEKYHQQISKKSIRLMFASVAKINGANLIASEWNDTRDAKIGFANVSAGPK